MVVVTVLAEGGLSRSPLLGSALMEVCSEIPGAMASSLMETSTFLVKAGGIPQRTSHPANPETLPRLRFYLGHGLNVNVNQFPEISVQVTRGSLFWTPQLIAEVDDKGSFCLSLLPPTQKTKLS